MPIFGSLILKMKKIPIFFPLLHNCTELFYWGTMKNFCKFKITIYVQSLFDGCPYVCEKFFHETLSAPSETQKESLSIPEINRLLTA